MQGSGGEIESNLKLFRVGKRGHNSCKTAISEVEGLLEKLRNKSFVRSTALWLRVEFSVLSFKNRDIVLEELEVIMMRE